MNILHLNTYDTGGSAKAAYTFHCVLKKEGFNSKMLVLKKREIIDDDVIEFKLNIIEKSLHYFNELKRKWKSRNIKKEYYFFNIDELIDFPVSIICKRMPFKPDIIVIHWVSGFISAKNIFELSKHTGAKVLWRFNDMNAFTGGCHYNNGCMQYQTGCGNCPALKNSHPNDLSFNNYRQKIKWLSKTDITFISSTSQIDEELKSSLLAKYCKTKFILLSADITVFKPDDTLGARKHLGLPVDKKIIFFGAQYLNDSRKGLKEWEAILNLLYNKLTVQQRKEILLVYACKDDINEGNLLFEAQKLPFLSNNAALAKVYQAATLFVSTSIEDAGPMMLVEAMLSGTPVIAFDIGLAKDAISNNITGFMVPLKDIDKFALSIKTILDLNTEQYNILRETCGKQSHNTFRIENEVNQYINLFKQYV